MRLHRQIRRRVGRYDQSSLASGGTADAMALGAIVLWAWGFESPLAHISLPQFCMHVCNHGHVAERDRDESGRPRSSRPRDALGRPLPQGSQGVPRIPDDLELTPAETL